MIDVSEIRDEVASHPEADWEAGETPLTGLPEEAVASRLGLSVPPGEMERIARAMSAAGSVTGREVAFADARDWRDRAGRSYVTEVRDQGGCGSSVSFATVATIEAQARIEYQEPTWDVDLSEADLFFGGAEKRCVEGWWPPEALKRAVNAGIPEEAFLPYKGDGSDHTGCSERGSRLLRIGEWKELLTPAQRKAWIDTNGPVVACMAVYQDLPSYRSGVYRHVTGGLVGHHAVTCVGYSEPEQVWICKNSWGREWGEEGFFRIAYGEAEIDTGFPAWGVARVSGTLVPPRPGPGPGTEPGGSTATATHVVLRHRSNGTTGLFARVGDAWKSALLDPTELSALGRMASATTAREVTYKGDVTVEFASWNQFQP